MAALVARARDLLSFAAGWALAGLWSTGFGASNVIVGGQFAGTITQVSSDGSGICLTEDATGRQRCSSPLRVVGSAPLAIGEHVEVTTARVPIDGGLLNEVYFVTIPPPAGQEGQTSAR
ncbi:MAG: hypothetical protein H0W81_06790 [Chloroflexi bacterium]|nr:hypothetical protein [Chloroflexota bacterium]